VGELEHRRAQFEVAHALGAATDARTALEAVVQVMSDVTNAGRPDDELQPVHAGDADALVAFSAVVQDALQLNPWLAAAPDAPAVQYWTAASGRLATVVVPPPPAAEYLRPVTDLSDAEQTRRPLPGGIFTSSGVPGEATMWQLYLAMNSMAHESGNLWRRPWLTWSMHPQPGIRTLRVRSALDWVRLLDEHPLPRGRDRMLCVNWRDVAMIADAVHVSAVAVCAIDGLRFVCSKGLSAPMYFTVESTVWLRWVFEDSRPVPTSVV
jgi:hypothetical protein